MRLSLIALALLAASCGSPTSPDSQPPPNTPQTHVIGPPPTASTTLVGMWYNAEEGITLSNGYMALDRDPLTLKPELVQADVRVKGSRVWLSAEHMPHRDAWMVFDGTMVADSISGWYQYKLLREIGPFEYEYYVSDTLYISYHRQ